MLEILNGAVDVYNSFIGFFLNGINLLKCVPEMTVTFFRASSNLPEFMASAAAFCFAVRIIVLVLHKHPGGE